MRLLLLNPNTTGALTERLARSVQTVLPPDVTLVPVTASEGFAYISSRAEAQIAGAGVLSIIAERQDDVDAAVIAAFGDPGLTATRELFDLPITGMTEAAMLTACAMGARFAFVTFSRTLAPWYSEQVARAGLESRFAGVHALSEGFGSISNVAEEMRAALLDLCKSVAAEADVLIIAGAPIAGLAPEIQAEVPAILLDPVQAAALQAIALWRLRPGGSDRGSFARPPAKPGTGLPKALGDWMAGNAGGA